MSNFLSNLNVMLQDAKYDGQSIKSAIDIAKRIKDSQQLIRDLEYQLSKLKAKTSGDLALIIRKQKPGLSVAVDRNGCKVAYKTKLMHFSPDFTQEVWVVTSPNARFSREFTQRNRSALMMGQDLTELANAIVNHFVNYYRTLGEDIDGTGILVIEEHRSTLASLVQWRNKFGTLNTRANRKGVEHQPSN